MMSTASLVATSVLGWFRSTPFWDAHIETFIAVGATLGAAALGAFVTIAVQRRSAGTQLLALQTQLQFQEREANRATMRIAYADFIAATNQSRRVAQVLYGLSQMVGGSIMEFLSSDRANGHPLLATLRDRHREMDEFKTHFSEVYARAVIASNAETRRLVRRVFAERMKMIDDAVVGGDPKPVLSVSSSSSDLLLEAMLHDLGLGKLSEDSAPLGSVSTSDSGD